MNTYKPSKHLLPPSRITLTLKTVVNESY